jgi:hypothetical protein
MRFKKILFIILAAFFIASSLFVRVAGLDKSPLSIGFDEASLGYNAYSLYLTGKDEYGTPYPLSLRSFNDFKPALYAYLAIPFIHFLDLNQTSTRLPSAIMGVVSLLFLFLIFKKISGKSALFSLGVVAFISFFPWRLHFSRVAFETNISMAFFTGAVWFLINFRKNTAYKIGLIVFSTLALYSYHASRLAIPILLVLVFLDPINFELERFRFKELLKKLWPVGLIFLLYLPLLLETNAYLLLTRLNQTNVFSHFYPFTPRELIFTPNVWLNLLGNPLYYLGGILSGHFFAYISPKNLSLLIYPGVIKSAQVISGGGMLGFAGGIFFFIGLISNLKELILQKQKRIIAYWILAGITPAVIAWEWYYPLRSLNAFPAIDLIAGLGIIATINYFLIRKHKFITYFAFFSLLLTIGAGSVYNVINEFNYGAWDTNGEFQPGGYKEGVPLLMSLKDNYKTVYIDSNQAQSYTIFWFYMKYPPENIQKIAYRRNVPGIEGPSTINFDNFVYKKFDWPNDKHNSNFVFWTSSEVKEDEIKATQGAKLYKILGPTGNWIASIITKD